MGEMIEVLDCNAVDLHSDAHVWDFGSGERFVCLGTPGTTAPDLEISRAEAIDLHWLIAAAIETGLPRASMLALAHRLSERLAAYTGDTSTTDAWRIRTGRAPGGHRDDEGAGEGE